eukprot:TCALIF_12823-PA protein Name:"Protein of unknown function" AED:0.89 eAED:0.91 QI:0/0/0/1/0/0/2/0/59
MNCVHRKGQGCLKPRPISKIDVPEVACLILLEGSYHERAWPTPWAWQQSSWWQSVGQFK